MAKQKRRLSPSMTITLAVLIGILTLLALAVGSGHWQVRPILSGSMSPGFPVGGVAVTDREPLADLKVNDVIITHPPGEPHFDLIHRVIQIKSLSADSAVVQTKGDANPAADPFVIKVHGPWMYRARFTVPLVGYAAIEVHSPKGRRLLLAIAALLVLFVVGRSLLANRRRGNAAQREDAGEAAESPAGSAEPEAADADEEHAEGELTHAGAAPAREGESP